MKNCFKIKFVRYNVKVHFLFLSFFDQKNISIKEKLDRKHHFYAHHNYFIFLCLSFFKKPLGKYY